jgi:hypothetical protein
MKNNLWVFGDSLSAKYSNSYTNPWGADYIKWKGYEPKIYGDIIAEKYNLIHINRAMPGSDNYSIFESICKEVDNIAKDDIIIVGWTELARFRLIAGDGLWKRLLLNKKEHKGKRRINESFVHVTNDMIDELLANRTLNQSLINEIENWMKLLKKLYGSNIIFWNWKQDGQLQFLNCVTPAQWPGSIRNETDGEIDDGHYSEEAHKILADLLIHYHQNGTYKKEFI